MNTLNLIVLRCRDLEKSRAFYELLGMRFAKHSHDGGPEHYAHEDERGVFELYPAKGGDGDKTGLGFCVDELDGMFTRMAELGFSPKPILEDAWGRAFVVRDPDGRRMEMRERGSK